jgi:hypothetical protein
MRRSKSREVWKWRTQVGNVCVALGTPPRPLRWSRPRRQSSCYVRPEIAPPRRASPPTIIDVQSAYDRAALAAGELHHKDLKIVGVDCHPGTRGRYACEVGFVKTDYDRTRVFLDAALVERGASKDLTLLRGLCRRLL